MTKLFGRWTTRREQRDELLSAYLDDQLSAEERARLETQLATDSALRAELGVLRHTVALVGELPPVPLSRNFILPQTVEARPRSVPAARPRRTWTAPLLTAATAVVGVLFVVVLAGDLLLTVAPRVAFAPAPEAQVMREVEASRAPAEPSAVSKAVEVEKEVAVTAEVELEVEAPAEAPPAGTVEAEGEAEAAAEEAAPPEVTVEGTPVLGAEALTEAARSTDDEVGMGKGAETPTPTPAALALKEQAATPESTAALDEAESVTATPDVLPTPTVVPGTPSEDRVADAETTPGEVAEAPGLEEGERAEPVEEERGVWGVGFARTPGLLWRALEVVLGLAALVLAAATVWAWRARRR